MNNVEKDKLIDKVAEQIKIDINDDELDPLYQLLDNLEVKHLKSYLPETFGLTKITVYQNWIATWLGWKTDGWYYIDNGDEVYLKDKFKDIPEITVTKFMSNITKSTKGYFYLKEEVKSNLI